MEDREPTIRSRALGEGLREAMNSAGYNASEMARQLDWSHSKVSRLLAGTRGGSSNDVSAWLATCRVIGPERVRLMKLCTDQNRPGLLQTHGSRLPLQLRELMDYENKSSAIGEYEASMVSGLLQTGDYARAVISRNVNVPAEEVDDRVYARLARQGLLSKPQPPRLTFFLHEPVLKTPVGSLATMSDQLHHLLRLSVRRNLTLRVVPTAMGAHAAMTGSFRLMDVSNFKKIVYLESETSSLFLEKPIEIGAYANILAALDRSALPEGQSKELIASIATELYADREDHDEHDRA
ncbi:hypothetical protein EV193_11283 [Herbihabitans rhizosphaerae]|uniref:DUF5753 domain-containing protein n=1 Tax=Herbihabitans rhizosphaerae TaxID=1872711 RepID=A0A4V2ERM3_9PSEU|nr:helix-turn-helix transcriptional regulator [Herbihabitans rhizosphaerae]RZS32449.1 hypothetical protein EV193_11283 [Herbihabitans rhizosphaerae]